MQQSIYTQISKRLGWDGTPVNVPCKELAWALQAKVKQGDANAFEAVFRIYRYAITPTTEEEREVMNVIIDAYQYGEKIFK